MSNPIKPVKEQLVDLFNAALIQEGYEAAYVVGDVVFGEVTPYDEGTFDPTDHNSHNTSVEISVGEWLEQVQSRLHYTRYNLASLVGIRAPEFAGDADATSTYDVLDAINEHLGVELTVEDVEDLLIEDGVVTLKAIAQSLQVFGTATLTIEGVAPQARVASFSAPSEPTETTPPASEPTDSGDTSTETTGESSEGADDEGTNSTDGDGEQV